MSKKTKPHKDYLRSLLVVIVSVIIVTMIGCGKSSLPRYDVSGTVTFNGQPVPAGQILFLPDTSQGNKGPATVIAIVDGHYDTKSTEKGTVGGPHVAVVTGYTSQPDPKKEMYTGATLFRDVRISVDLPKETTIHDIDVPCKSS